MSVDWPGRRVLVTGGASFIGSHLVDALMARGAMVRVADDLSSGTLAAAVEVEASPPAWPRDAIDRMKTPSSAA